MLLRLTRVRLRTEWLLLLCLAFLIVLYIWFCGLDMRTTSLGTFEQFEEKYGAMFRDGLSRDEAERMTTGFALKDPIKEGTGIREAYEAILRKLRGFAYSRLLMGAENCAFLLMGALAVLYLCPQFGKRRAAQWLSAGYGWGQVFLSMTLTYYACAVLLWLISSSILLGLYRISFSPEERGFFRTTQLSWLCNVLFSAALAYLSAFLLRRPLPTYLAALAVWFLLRVESPALSASPVVIMGSGEIIKSWDPGMDAGSLAAGNWITLGFLAAVVILSWLSFQKRGLN